MKILRPVKIDEYVKNHVNPKLLIVSDESTLYPFMGSTNFNIIFLAQAINTKANV
jgi:hypothetical protein